ncbi:MAG: hypothetical protein AVDCRST_MAG85-1751, partial [uncultured Solirubrobacteraceae bacterium]
ARDRGGRDVQPEGAASRVPRRARAADATGRPHPRRRQRVDRRDPGRGRDVRRRGRPPAPHEERGRLGGLPLRGRGGAARRLGLAVAHGRRLRTGRRRARASARDAVRRRPGRGRARPRRPSPRRPPAADAPRPDHSAADPSADPGRRRRRVRASRGRARLRVVRRPALPHERGPRHGAAAARGVHPLRGPRIQRATAAARRDAPRAGQPRGAQGGRPGHRVGPAHAVEGLHARRRVQDTVEGRLRGAQRDLRRTPARVRQCGGGMQLRPAPARACRRVRRAAPAHDVPLRPVRLRRMARPVPQRAAGSLGRGGGWSRRRARHQPRGASLRRGRHHSPRCTRARHSAGL